MKILIGNILLMSFVMGLTEIFNKKYNADLTRMLVRGVILGALSGGAWLLLIN